MKKLVNIAILIVWLTPIGLQAFAAPKVAYAARTCEVDKPCGKPQSVTLLIQGMRTKSCPLLVRAALKKLPGIKDTSFDLEKKTATVKYQPERTSPEEMQNAIKTQAGFDSKVIAR